METKTCTNCKEPKPLDDFAVRKGYRGGHHTWCKPCCYQRTCVDWRKANPDKAKAIANRAAKTEQAGVNRRANRARIAEETGKAYDHDYMVEWRKKNVEENPDFFWESHLRHSYHMSREQYETLLAKQNGGCAICGGQNSDHRKLAIDHDHSCCSGQKRSCGKCIRGLLCSRCNHCLGHARDSVEILESAVRYLKQHKKV
jgi:Recombination endonuclease VII